MSKKTAITQAIEWIEKDPKGMLHAYDKQIMTEYLQSLLQYERECIEGAYNSGYYKGADREEFKDDNYFTSTYNNPQGGGGE